MNSYVATASTIDRKWYVVDAEGKTLGRLASEWKEQANLHTVP